MTGAQIVVAVVSVLLVASVIYATISSRRASVYESARRSLESRGIRFGPIRHTVLRPELIDRIRLLEEVFADVYPISHQEWLDGFQRDQSPEKQIAIWEKMASAYSTILSQNEIGAEGHKEAFILLLTRPTDLESSISNLKHLTTRQAENLIALY